MLFSKKISTFAPLKRRETRDEFGRMAEWSNAAVLKTVDLHGSGGSNPSSSANRFPIGSLFFLCGRRGIRTPGPARPTNLFLVYSVNTLTTVRYGTGPKCSYHHFISLGGPPGPRSRSSPHSLQYDCTCVSTCVNWGYSFLYTQVRIISSNRQQYCQSFIIN